MDRGAWKATVHGVTKEVDMPVRLNNNSQDIYTFPPVVFHGSLLILFLSIDEDLEQILPKKN